MYSGIKSSLVIQPAKGGRVDEWTGCDFDHSSLDIGYGWFNLWISTRWCPRSLAFTWFISTISLGLIRGLYLYSWDYDPSTTGGAPPCMEYGFWIHVAWERNLAPGIHTFLGDIRIDQSVCPMRSLPWRWEQHSHMMSEYFSGEEIESTIPLHPTTIVINQFQM